MSKKKNKRKYIVKGSIQIVNPFPPCDPVGGIKFTPVPTDNTITVEIKLEDLFGPYDKFADGAEITLPDGNKFIYREKKSDTEPPMPNPKDAGKPPSVDLSNPIQKGGKIK